MRKLGSDRESKDKNKRNTMIMSGVMLFLLLISTAGYAIVSSSQNSESSEENYEGVVNAGNYWTFEHNGQNIYLRNSPDEVRNISVLIGPQVSVPTYSSSVLYIASENEGVYTEVASSLGRFSQRVQRACYSNCSKDLPEKSCASNLIVWNESSYNLVRQEENCIFIDGDLRAVDAFLYKVFNKI